MRLNTLKRRRRGPMQPTRRGVRIAVLLATGPQVISSAPISAAPGKSAKNEPPRGEGPLSVAARVPDGFTQLVHGPGTVGRDSMRVRTQSSSAESNGQPGRGPVGITFWCRMLKRTWPMRGGIDQRLGACVSAPRPASCHCNEMPFALRPLRAESSDAGAF